MVSCEMEIKSEDIKKICVLGWGLKGDLFIRIPVIEAIRAFFPDAELAVIVDPGNIDVIENHPDVDVVFPFNRNKKPLFKYLASTLSNIISLRKERFDLFVNLYSGGSSPFITKMVNARIRLGFDHSKALRRSNNLLVAHPSLCGNWSKAFGTILQPLGVGQEAIRRGTTFVCTQAAFECADKLLDENVAYVGFNLGAGSDEKLWPIASYVELARYIYQKYHYLPLVFTNPGMESLANEFSAKCSAFCNTLQLPLINLDEVGAVMQRCQCIITGDTGLMHLAFGLKRPCLVMFTYTRPEIVEPEDCIMVSCFIENPEHADVCGNPLGTKDMPVEYASVQFDRLYNRTMR